MDPRLKLIAWVFFWIAGGVCLFALLDQPQLGTFKAMALLFGVLGALVWRIVTAVKK
jgi:hypothetical protein